MPEADTGFSPTSFTFSSHDGTVLVVDEAGSRQGTPVLLLHGLRSSAHANWHRTGTVDALVAAGFFVIAPDARGHGRSGRMKGLPMRDRGTMARDVLALADRLELESFHVVGYSMGSMVAVGVAASDRRVRSLVLGGVGTEGVAGRFARRRGGVVHKRVDSGLGLVPEGGLLARIAVPTLLLAGETDRMLGSPASLAARIPGARLVTVPGTHLTALSAPEFRDALVAFLSGHAGHADQAGHPDAPPPPPPLPSG